MSGLLRRAGILAAVLLAGLALGVTASYLVWPVRCADASPSDLSPQARCRWAETAALAYGYDSDLARARERLSLLGPDGPTALCALAGGECRACAGDSATSARLLLQGLAISCDGE